MLLDIGTAFSMVSDDLPDVADKLIDPFQSAQSVAGNLRAIQIVLDGWIQADANFSLLLTEGYDIEFLVKSIDGNNFFDLAWHSLGEFGNWPALRFDRRRSQS